MPDPTDAISALRKRLPKHWTLAYGIRERTLSNRKAAPVGEYEFDVTVTGDGYRIGARRFVSAATLDRSYLRRPEIEAATWESLAEEVGRYLPHRPRAGDGGGEGHEDC